MEVFVSILGGSCGAAIVSGGFVFIRYLLRRKDDRAGKLTFRERKKPVPLGNRLF